jgi:DHA1 family tetracycline resistance protein-like MFS transporter
VDDNRQGELQGGLASLMSLASIIAPPLMTQIFFNFSQASSAFYYPGAPFLLSAMLTLISLAVFINISRGQTGEK